MDFSPNKKPIQVIKEVAFGGTYFRDILVLMGSGTESHGKNLSKNMVLNAEHH